MEPSSILVLLESCVYSACMAYTVAECTVNELLMMGRGTEIGRASCRERVYRSV
jgi:hypothetical protein